jgi:hypothetical protein
VLIAVTSTPSRHVVPGSLATTSSVLPSQSLSTLSQASSAGLPAGGAVQVSPVPAMLQTSIPLRRQSPTPLKHAVPRSG